MRLIIVESPTKARTIEKFLHSPYRVLSSYGHIRDLPKGEFGIDLEHNFTPKYVIPTKARKTVALLKNEVQKADITILATDEDREGEAIAWHLVQVLGLNAKQIPNSKFQIPKPYERIAFHEITKSAIEEALKNPRDINMNLVDAQQARRILDRIVGYKLSPFLWSKVARGLSAGRVQSVAVRLIVEREREIQNFIPQEYWTIEALLKKTKIHPKTITSEFSAFLIKKNGKALDKFALKDQAAVDELMGDLRGAEYRVANIEKKEAKRNPPPPFTTSTLQQEAFKRFRFSAKLTMTIAQNLYERGLITYHRTDSLNLSEQSLFGAKKFIEKSYGTTYWAGFFRKYKTKSKTAQEAHEAIRPTYPDNTPEKMKLEKNHLKLYDLIWRRFIASQMAQASFDATIVDVEAKKMNTPIKKSKKNLAQHSPITSSLFRATGQILTFDGFLKIYPMKFEETELPPLENNEAVELRKLVPSQHFTQPPSRYTEGTLVKALEEYGIGRPSTYAPILSTIQERGYVEKDGKKAFVPTELGIAVNDLLVAHFPSIVDVKFTAEMEKDLDDIAAGRKQYIPVVRQFYEPFTKILQQKYQEVSKKEFTETPTKKICPECGGQIVIRLGKFGKFYACSRFPKCTYTEPLEQTRLNILCPKCEKGAIIEKRTKTKKVFYGCERYPECDFALWQKPTGEKCPQCGALMVKKGTREICSRKECGYAKKTKGAP
jgi:DNA topoisomerase-1